MAEKTKCLTKTEAIAQGYSLCGTKNEDVQELREIKSITNEELEHRYYVLADKEPTIMTIDGGDICELVQDHIVSNYDLNHEDDAIYDKIKASVDWDKIALKVTKSLKKNPIWYLTKIELIAD